MEAIWALGRVIRGNRLQSMRFSDSDSEAGSESTVTSHHVLSLVYSRHSIHSQSERRPLNKRKKMPFFNMLVLEDHQPQSTLAEFSADVLQLVLHCLTEWDLLRALGVCREWRGVMMCDEAVNRMFWQNEVLMYQRDSHIMLHNTRVHDHYFGARPPPVCESSAFFLLRLKKLHEVVQRRHFYCDIETGEQAPAESRRCVVTTVRLLLLDFLHGRDLGAYIPAAGIAQGGVIMVWVSFKPPGPLSLWAAPLVLLSLLWLLTSACDAVLMVSGLCSKRMRELDTRLWQTRWVTVSRHPTLNRWTLALLAPLWSAFLMLFLTHIDDLGDTTPYWKCFMPLFTAALVTFVVLMAELRMQRSIYFHLDAGYCFVEPDILSEAERQADATWRHLVWPRVLVVLFGVASLLLLLHRLEPLPGWSSHHAPWSLIFIPCYCCIGFIFAHLYRFPRFSSRRRSHHATYVWTLVCVLIFFIFLGLDLDLTELLDFHMDNPVVPMWAVSVPLWAALLGPCTRLCDE